MEKNSIDSESQQIWHALGPWWDASVEDGDYFHRAFVFPAVEKLLCLRGGEVVLDAGCGNGALSRRMAKNDAEVFGIDFSSSLLHQAKERSQGKGIRYEEMSLTDSAALQLLASK